MKYAVAKEKKKANISILIWKHFQDILFSYTKSKILMNEFNMWSLKNMPTTRFLCIPIAYFRKKTQETDADTWLFRGRKLRK